MTESSGSLVPSPERPSATPVVLTPVEGTAAFPAHLRELRDEVQRFLLEYEFGLREVETKISILRDEFQQMHEYNPIEHVTSRVKSIDSVLDKVRRKNLTLDLETMRREITDIAGLRVTCSFTGDVYRLFELLTRQDDIRLLAVKDYIAEPKENGYKSLHAIVEVPVFLSSGRVGVTVEVQFRTIAMDFWASLEHKIFYKYQEQVPERLSAELRDAAVSAAELDARMERLHHELHGGDAPEASR
jgi:putative GTP pyrophosphokinase